VTTYNLKYSISDIDQIILLRTLREANKANGEITIETVREPSPLLAGEFREDFGRKTYLLIHD
jgi:hypothetical protein